MRRYMSDQPRRGRCLAVALCVLGLLVGAGAASAQLVQTPPIKTPLLSEPIPPVSLDPKVPPQTSLLPPDIQAAESLKPKWALDWSYVAGRKRDQPDAETFGATDGDECFRDAAFEDVDHGFAVGFRVVDPSDDTPPCAQALDDPTKGQPLQQPVLYSYTKGEWEEVPLPKLTGDERPDGGAYLAAVATFTRYPKAGDDESDPQLEAFAVGGASDEQEHPARFPRTEGSWTVDSGQPDPAGSRPIVLWYHDANGDGTSEWQELAPCGTATGQADGQCIPEGMGPLTAVAVARTQPQAAGADFKADPLDYTDVNDLPRPCLPGDPTRLMCADLSTLGVKRAEAFAFFGGAPRQYAAGGDDPGYRGQLWLWHCLDKDSKPCIDGESGQQEYHPDPGNAEAGSADVDRGEGFESRSMSDPSHDPTHKRDWQVPPAFRIRDIAFYPGRRDMAYAVSAGCCVDTANHPEHRALERLGQVQVWNGLTSDRTEGGFSLLPGHWWGTSHGGALVNRYQPPPSPGSSGDTLAQDDRDLDDSGSTGHRTCWTYVNAVRPLFTGDDLRDQNGNPVSNPLPAFPVPEPEMLRDWQTTSPAPEPYRGPDPQQNCRVKTTVTGPGLPADPNQVQIPSQTPSLFSVALAPSGSEDVEIPQLESLRNPRGSAYPSGGFAVGGADGSASATPFGPGTLSSYTVRRQGALGTSEFGQIAADSNHLAAIRDGMTSDTAPLPDSGFTEFLQGPTFALFDRVWGAATRGAGVGTAGWMAGSDTANGGGILYRVEDRGWTAGQVAFNAFETTGASASNGGSSTEDAIRYPERLSVTVDSLHAVAMTPSGGGGFAVGDNGAILRYQDPDAVEPVQKVDRNIGATQRTDLAPRDGFDKFKPERSAEPGTLPALDDFGPELPGGDRRLEVLNRPGPGRYDAIAVSENGREAWAVGGDSDGLGRGAPPRRARLAHFDGHSWRECSFAAGSPCAVFAGEPVHLRSITTVPGADGFEAYAVGWGPVPDAAPDDPDNPPVGKAGPVQIFHLVDGRWERAARASEVAPAETAPRVFLPTASNVRLNKVVAFSPDDVWVVGNVGNDTNASPIIYHMDGKGWAECTDDGTRPGGAEGKTASACSDLGTEQVGDDPAKSRLPRSGVQDSSDPILTAEKVGDRLYIAGVRSDTTWVRGLQSSVAEGLSVSDAARRGRFPFVLWTDRRDDSEECDGHPCRLWHADEAEGGLEAIDRYGDQQRPELGNAKEEELVFAMGKGPDGRLDGWLIQKVPFGATGPSGITQFVDSVRMLGPNPIETHRLIHFDGERGKWRPYEGPNLVDELLAHPAVQGGSAPPELVPPPQGAGGTLTGTILSLKSSAPLVQFKDGKWQYLPSPLVQIDGNASLFYSDIDAISVQPNGDIWGVAAKGFFRYTRRPASDPFRTETVPLSIPDSERERNVYDIEHGADGAVWVGAHSDTVARRDPVTGWDTLSIKGWRTRGGALAPVYDMAFGPDGAGFAVGGGGRIASLDSGGAVFDAEASALAAGDLRGVDVAPDGSALAVGEDATVLYRPPGGPWRAQGSTVFEKGDGILSVSMPRRDEAYIATDDGRIAHGVLAGGQWTFTREDGNLPAGAALHKIALRGDGTGFAVGDGGLILERDPSRRGKRRWVRRTDGPAGTRDLFGLDLSPKGSGAVITSRFGDVITLVGGRFELARRGDPYDPNAAYANSHGEIPMRAVSVSPGSKDGQLEVWIGQAGKVYRYTSDPDDPLIGRREPKPLPDTPSFGSDDMPIVTFGDSICRNHVSAACRPWQGLPTRNQVILRRIVQELTRRANESGAPKLALYTGGMTNDASNHAGFWGFDQTVMDPLRQVGIPTFAALSREEMVAQGQNDIAVAQERAPVATPSDAAAHVRGNDFSTEAWKTAFVDAVAPWGPDGDSADGIDGVASPRRKTSAVSCNNRGGTDAGARAGSATEGIEVADQAVCIEEVNEPTGTVGRVKLAKLKVAGGGARTHYAFAVSGEDGQERVRVVVLNTAEGSTSLSSEDNPKEATTQLQWLDKALKRDPDVPAVVMTNRPTYTYGPGQDKVATDATAIEQKLLDNNATLLVTGAISNNQKYWVTRAAGLHEPAQGSAYPTTVPDGARLTAINASGAGGNLTEENADRGGWLGYSIAHVGKVGAGGDNVSSILGGVPPAPDQVPEDERNQLNAARECAIAGTPEKTASGEKCEAEEASRDVFVENRPILDGLYITGASHVLRAGQRMTAKGFGIGPANFDQAPRHMAISTPAITHRYDLVMADPKNPSRPALDENGEYKSFSSDVATIDRQSGVITTKRPGPSERQWGLVLLSVGSQATTYTVAFDPRRSFVARPAAKISRAPFRAIVGNFQPQRLPPPPNTQPPPNPTVGNIETPTLPRLPGLPPLNAAPVNPPAPPSPPPPPGSPAQVPLNLAIKPVGLNVPPPTSVVPPPAPPIQPAPPGGARREARQRQAATAKSEQGSGEGGAEQSGDSGGDGANSYTRAEPNGAGARRHPGVQRNDATRRDSERATPSFVTVGHEEPVSAWSRTLMYGGGITLMALMLALGWNTGRPRPGRRPPEPAPAWARRRWRR